MWMATLISWGFQLRPQKAAPNIRSPSTSGRGSGHSLGSLIFALIALRIRLGGIGKFHEGTD
jgi:hypothetical protein